MKVRTGIRTGIELQLVAVLLAALAGPDPARAQADSAEAYYRAGLAYLEAPDAKIPSPVGILDGITLWEDLLRLVGRDHISRARRAFERALTFDSAHAWAAIQLAKLALGSLDAQALGQADAALARAAGAPAPPADLWVWWARIAAALGGEGGSAHARRYAAEGGDAALAQLAEAQAHIAAGRDSAGAAAYFAGLDAPSLSLDAAAAYYRDLAPLVRSDEGEEWEATPTGTGERAAWLRRFWARRAAEAGVSREERLAEHYRRIRVAYERYRRTSEREASLADARAVPHGLHRFGLDDRGIVYLRHGDPDKVVRTIAAGAAPNESWLYRRPEDDLVLHFVALRRAGEFVLVTDPLAALGASAIDASTPICAPLDCGFSDAVLAILEDRESLDPRYAVLASRFRSAFQAAKGGAASGRGNATGRVQDFATARLALAGEMLEAAAGALAEDSYAPELGRPLPFYYDTYAFRGGGGQTEFVVSVAVPGTELPATPAGGGSVVYPVELDVLLVDSLAGVSLRADTAGSYYAARPLGQGENLRLVVELEAAPGSRYIHHVRVRTRGAGGAGGAYAGPLTIPDFRGDTLMLSDLVLAEPAGKGWRRGDVELGLVPPRRFAPGTAVSLFYEIYNAPPDAPIRTRIRVERLAGGGVLRQLGRVFGFGRASAPIELSFDGISDPDPAGVIRRARRVQLGLVRPGPYRLTVEVSSGGQVARRTTTLAMDRALAGQRVSGPVLP